MTARSDPASSARTGAATGRGAAAPGVREGLLQRARAWFARKAAGLFWLSYFTAMASTVGVALE